MPGQALGQTNSHTNEVSSQGQTLFESLFEPNKFSPRFRRRTLRLEEIKEPAHAYTISKWQRLDRNPGRLT